MAQKIERQIKSILKYPMPDINFSPQIPPLKKIKDKTKITEAIQVCYDINESNKERELKGLKNAMKRFNLKKGLVIVFEQQGQEGNIKIVSAAGWLLEK